MKNEVLLKREEIKLKIDQEADKLIDKLDGCLVKLKQKLIDEQFINKARDLEEKRQLAMNRLEKNQNRLDVLIMDDLWWENISNEIINELSLLSGKLNDLQDHLVSQKDLNDIRSEMRVFNNLNLIDINPSSLDIFM